MVDIIFYEKPGCINNTKQKRLLQNAGHQVESRNLLTESWDRKTLSKYFGDIPVSLCFNSAAPEIKSGLLKPFRLSDDEALSMMIKNPLLIRRPLIRAGDEYRVGFEVELINKWVGLSEKDLQELSEKVDLQACPREKDHAFK